ncbi:MAG TPA: JAB domain-containing protein [Niabella sp.]
MKTNKQLMKQLDRIIVSEATLVYTSRVKAADRPQVKGVQAAYDLFMHTWNKRTIDFVETAKAMYLNSAHRVIAIITLGTGGFTGTVVDPRLVFFAALRCHATGLILAHNHPSGNLKPSSYDEMLTRRIRNIGQELDIRLIDHLIISSEGYFSMVDEGLI